MLMEVLRCIGKKSILTNVCRAAEVCAIECAKILLEHNADIDA